MRRQRPQTIYLPPPQYQAAPPPSPEDLAARQSAQEQLMRMQENYNQQMAGLQQQFERSQNTSTSVIDSLRAALAQQQQSNAANRELTDRANLASASQLELLSQQRDASSAQLSDQRNSQASMLGSAFQRLTRRRAARQIRY